MANIQNNCLIARQPILNRNSEIVAYELLFRPVGSTVTAQANASFATANVALNTLLSFGVEQVLGIHQGFLNVELEFLMSDALEILPENLIVLELLETLDVTPALIQRCRDLRAKGFTIAIDDHEFDPTYDELYTIAEIVKLDLMQTPLERLPAMVQALRRYPIKLLAEKVESQKEFRACLDMGFDLFQGYHFAKPSLIEKRSIDETTASLLKLVQLLGEEADIDAIEEIFRRSPGLSYKLLQLINSVLLSTREHIKSIRHALVMLGRHQLQRWMQLALFANDDSQSQVSPLVEMAAVRASFMENLAGLHPRLKSNNQVPDQAFMVGILSVLDIIFDIDLAEVVANLRLPQEITMALITREGPLGNLLTVAEMVDQSYGNIDINLIEAHGLTQDDVRSSMFKAYQWLGAQK